MHDAWNEGYIGTYGDAHYVVGYHYIGTFPKFQYDSLHLFAKGLLYAIESETNFDLRNSDEKFQYNMVSEFIIMFKVFRAINL